MHSQNDVTWLYLSIKNGGTGLINTTNHYKNVTINFSNYLLNSEEQFLKLTSSWQVTWEKSIHQRAQRYCDGTGHDIQQQADMRKLLQKLTIKSTRINKLEPKLKRKHMHGQFAKYFNQSHVDKKWSNQWLKSSTLKRATESTIAAIQEHQSPPNEF